MSFEDERIVKEIRNNVNRLVNCETANLQKTIKSSVEQIENIKLIKEKKRFKTKPSYDSNYSSVLNGRSAESGIKIYLDGIFVRKKEFFDKK